MFRFGSLWNVDFNYVLLQFSKWKASNLLHRQARGTVFKVFRCSKLELDNGRPVHDIAKYQERTAEACGVGLSTVKCIVNEKKCFLNARASNYQRQKADIIAWLSGEQALHTHTCKARYRIQS
jgi:hypothetical protein